jgi:hypothetical protein
VHQTTQKVRAPLEKLGSRGRATLQVSLQAAGGWPRDSELPNPTTANIFPGTQINNRLLPSLVAVKYWKRLAPIFDLISQNPNTS